MGSLRAFIADLAEEGGRIAREHAGRIDRHSVRRKGAHDYVTAIDTLVERALVDAIRARFPEHGILGEEGTGDRAGSAGDSAAPLWIIDPIDGTTNYLHGYPAYAVSIALHADGAVRCAAIHDSVRRETFVAEHGYGAWLGEQPLRTSPCTDLSEALLATALPFRTPEALADASAVFVAMQPRCDDQRRSGSAALDLAQVAAGRVDGYYELGIHPWDTAAGELLVACAGGVATDYRGGSAGLLTRRSLVAGCTPALHQAILQQVASLVPWLDRPAFASR